MLFENGGVYMLCQNCKRNDAAVHLKRIINGEAAEIHLCADCAGSLGVSDGISGFSPFGGFFGGVLASSDTRRISNKVLRCETCGFSFDDISKTGFPGCPDCYRVFLQKMRPMIRKIHGSAVYKGENPTEVQSEPEIYSTAVPDKLTELKMQLDAAVSEQNFEFAAVLRDEIKKLSGEEGKQ